MWCRYWWCKCPGKKAGLSCDTVGWKFKFTIYTYLECQLPFLRPRPCTDLLACQHDTTCAIYCIALPRRKEILYGTEAVEPMAHLNLNVPFASLSVPDPFVPASVFTFRITCTMAVTMLSYTVPKHLACIRPSNRFPIYLVLISILPYPAFSIPTHE